MITMGISLISVRKTLIMRRNNGRPDSNFYYGALDWSHWPKDRMLTLCLYPPKGILTNS